MLEEIPQSTINFSLALIALLWTMYQQYTLSRICSKCPYFVNRGLEIKVSEK